MEDIQNKERIRSPNYPTFGLATAIDRASALYKRNGKAAVHTGAAVKAWGYNSLNGRSLGVLGALRQYRLIDDVGAKDGARMVRVSGLGLTILLSPEASQARRDALLEAARAPKVFADLWAQYNGEFPADEGMISNLTLGSSFTEEAATKAIAALRETLDLLQHGAGGITIRPPGDSDGDAADDDPATERKSKTRERAMPDTGRESIDFPFPLMTGGQAVLRLPRTMSEAEFVMLSTMLSTMLNGMKAALVPVATPITPPSEE